MKKLKVILTVMVCIILTGCNTSYIDNKKVTTTEETSYSENPEGPTTEQAPGLFSFSSSLLITADNDEMRARDAIVPIKEGVNEIKAFLECTPDLSLKWDVIPARIYLIDNGNPVPIKIGDSDYNIYQDVEYTAYERLMYEVSFDHRALSSDKGKLTVIVIYNMEALPGLGVERYAAAQTYYFYYNNAYYSEDTENVIEEITGCYLEIPEEYMDNAEVADIGPKDIYTDEYQVRNLHLFEDVEVNSTSELYTHINLRGENLGDVMMGIICDGELMQFSDGTYFKCFNCNNGARTLQYPLEEFDNIEPGLHYFQIVYWAIDSFEERENSVSEVTNRFRINISKEAE